MRKGTFARIILRVLYYLNNKYLYSFFRRIAKRRLSKLLLHINTECNYDCRYCYVDKSRKALPRNKWFSLIDEAAGIGVSKVSILGGEPLISPFLVELTAYAVEKKMRPYIYTNGSLIDIPLLKKLKPYNPVFVFKYEIDDASYQWHTSQSHFSVQDIEDRMRLCVEKGFKVITFTTLLKQNHNTVDAVFEKVRSLGAIPAFERYLPVKGSAENALLEITDDENEKAMNIIARRLKNVMPEWISAIRLFGRSCGCYSDILSITTTGEVLPCAYLPESASIGNVRDMSLGQLADVYEEKKQTIFKVPDVCSTCKNRFECAGGCFTYSYLQTGEYTHQCKQGTPTGFCAYMLVDLFDNVDSKLI